MAILDQEGQRLSEESWHEEDQTEVEMMDRLSEEGGREESEATLYQDIENLFGCTSKLGHFCLREKLLNGIAINHLL